MNKVILICAPTASGKSALANTLSHELGGHIVNADSQQQFKDLPTLTARPTPQEVGDELYQKHHLYGYLKPDESPSLGNWHERVTKTLSELFAQNIVPIIVGGTGFYIRSLLTGVPSIPPAPQDLKNYIEGLYSPEKLDKLKQLDSASYMKLHPNDDYRINRALSIVMSTGKTIKEWEKEAQGQNLDIFKILITPDREELYPRINKRFVEMVNNGAVEEVKTLLAQGINEEAPIRRVIGFQQIEQLVNGEISKEEAIEKGQQETRQYAKRQYTWFRNKITGDFVIGNCVSSQDELILIKRLRSFLSNQQILEL